MKRNHSAEVSALAEVVRAGLAKIAESGRVLSEPTRLAFACVERWLAGDTVTKEELEDAREAAHQSRVAREQREQDDALVWANAAIGNLAWMTQKARGWKDGERTVLDAAVSMVSSLGVDGVACRERFEALRASTFERALASNQLPKPPRSAPPLPGSQPRRVHGELEAFIGVVASARLSTLAAIFDPTRRGDDKALRDRMKTRHYTVYEPVLAFERRFGGLVMPNALGEEDAEWIFGTHACLSSEAHGDPRGGDAHAGARGKRALIPVVYTPNDVVYFLDGHGAAWAQDTIEGGAAVRFAADGDRMVARIIHTQWAFARRFDGAHEELQGKRGEEVAAALGLPFVPEASDHLARLWADERSIVIEERQLIDGPLIRGPWQTIVAGRDRKKIASAIHEESLAT